MGIKAILDHYADYDRWANARFVERLKGEAPAVLAAPAPGSFPSLRTTLLHIRDAENAWWGRLTGTPTVWPAEESLDITSLIRHAERFSALVHELEEAALMEERTYKDLKGNAHVQSAWQMVMHCLNHGTQHRGQLITQMRSLGLADIPANDLVVFQRSLDR